MAICIKDGGRIVGNNIVIKPCLYSCNNIITKVNTEFTDLTGYKMDESVGKSVIEIGNMLKINLEPLVDNINSNYCGYIFTKYLKAREVNISLLYNKGENEKIYIFALKPNSRLEDKLTFVEQTFIDYISGVAIYSVPDLLLLKANQKYLDFLDPPFNKEENSIGRPISEIVTGFKGTQSEIIFNTVLESQKTSYIKELKFDKFTRGITYLDSKQTPIFENGKIKYIFDTAIEVTESVLKNQSLERQNNIIVKQKEQLEEEKEKLIRMIETFNLSVVRLSYPDLRIVDINKQAFNMIKLLCPNIESLKKIKDDKIEGLYEIFKPSKYYQSINEVLKEKKTTYLNNQKHIVDGNVIYWNIIFEPILDLNGKIQEILIITIDVTNEIKSNIVMKKTLKLQGEYFVNISHELKTPLNVICSTVQLFDMYCNSGSLDERKNLIVKYMDSIKQNSYRISKLINNIVDLSKIEAGFFKLHLSNNNIVEVIESIVTSIITFTHSKGLNIIFDTDIEEKIIACDPEKIERIVLNLISNAIKFSNVGGEIFVGVYDRNKFIEISVKDSGIGIKEKDLDIIFDRFKQVDKSLLKNAEGTGIGLSLVKSIAQLHGGSIHVESEFGKGSKFIVMIPSEKVVHESTLYNNKMLNKDKTIQVELSDIIS